jgi:hypothetical protein
MKGTVLWDVHHVVWNKSNTASESCNLANFLFNPEYGSGTFLLNISDFYFITWYHIPEGSIPL